MYKPTIIDLPLPPMGGKCWLLENKGLFVLEPGPGTIRTLAVTHAGSGSIEVIDGIPNENGFFPDEAMQRPAPFTQDEYAMIQTARRTQADPPDWLALKIQDHQIWGSRRGRIFYKAIPAVMGSWMLDAGFIHGLTVKAMGDASAVNTFASIVWMPFGKRK